MLGEIITTARVMNQSRDTRSVALKVAEETGELAQAVNKNQGYDEIVSEVADVIIAVTDVGWQAFLDKWGKYALDNDVKEKYETDLMTAIGEKLNKWVQVYGE